MEKDKINYAVLKLLQDEYKNNNNFFEPNTLFIKANIDKEEFYHTFYFFYNKIINENNIHYSIKKFFNYNLLYKIDSIKEDLLKNDNNIKKIFYNLNYEEIEFLIENNKLNLLRELMDEFALPYEYPIYKHLKDNVETNKEFLKLFLDYIDKNNDKHNSEKYTSITNLTKNLIYKNKFEECDFIINNYKDYIIDHFISINYILNRENFSTNKNKIEYLIKNNDVLKMNNELLRYSLINNKKSLIRRLQKEDDFEKNRGKLDNLVELKEKLEEYLNAQQKTKIKRSLQNIIQEKPSLKKRKI